MANPWGQRQLRGRRVARRPAAQPTRAPHSHCVATGSPEETPLEAEIAQVIVVCGCDLGFEGTVILIERLSDDAKVVSNGRPLRSGVRLPSARRNNCDVNRPACSRER